MLAALVVLLLLPASGVTTSGSISLVAQSPDWGAQVVVSPFPSPYLSEWERNPQSLTLAVTFTGEGSRAFRVEGFVRSRARGEVARAESPPLTVAAGPSVQLFNSSDLFTWRVLPVRRQDVEQALRTGVLPEDDYEICARIFSSTGIQLAEDCAPMEIVLPDPPELLFPVGGDGVVTAQPTFQWTPVLVPPTLGTRYRVQLAERFTGQTPLVALEANRLHLDEVVAGVPLLLYPADGIQLEAGKEYVWRVEALDGLENPLQPGGLRSQVEVFRAEATLDPLGDENWSELDLVPGVARLVDLTRLEREVTPFGVVLNGVAALELLAPEAGSLPVQVRDLVVDRLGMRITAGEVSGPLPGPLGDLLGSLPPGMRIDRLRYRPDAGLRAGGAYAFGGNGPSAALDGELQVTAAGLFGTLEARFDDGISLVPGGDPVGARVHRVRTSLPGGVTEIEGVLEAFGAPTRCPLVAALGEDGRWAPVVRCGEEIELPLVAGGTAGRLSVLGLMGPLDIDLSAGLPAAGGFGARLTASGVLYPGPATTGCFANLDLRLDPDGLEVDGVRSRCGLPGAMPMELDWLHVGLSNLRVDALSWVPGSGVEMALRLDLLPRLPMLPGVPLPGWADVVVTAEGFRVPALDEPAIPERFDVEGMAFRIQRASGEPFLLTWTEWEARSAEAVMLELDVAWRLGNLSAPTPSCLSGGVFRLEAARLAEAALRGQVDSPAGTGGDPCRVPLAGGAELLVHGWEGELALSLLPDPRLVSLPSVRGEIRLPDSSACADGGVPATLQLPAGALQMRPDGTLAGRIEGWTAPCPIVVGGAELLFTEGVLEISGSPGSSGAPEFLLTAGASVRLDPGAEPVSGVGTLVVELVSGEVRSGELVLAGPVRIPLPRQAPVFTFVVDEARLNAAGLSIEGTARSELAGGGAVDAGFEEVVLDLEAHGIREGRIRLGEAVMLEASVGGVGLEWRASLPGDPFEVVNGLRLVLPEGAVIDAAGLALEGSAAAALRVEERDVPLVVASFDESFRVAFDPTRVDAGRADFLHGGLSVAWLDPSGFHLDLVQLGLGVIPARMGLPSEAVAWLELRDPAGVLRVDATREGDGIRIRSRVGTPVVLHLPFAAGNQESPATEVPRVEVEVDLLLDDDGARVIGGEVRARMPGDTGDLRGRGLPLVVESVHFRAGTDDDGLALEARLELPGFDEPGSGAGDARVEFLVTESGRLLGAAEGTGSFVLSLVGGSDRVQFRGTRVRADFDVGLLSGQGDWDVEMEGALAVALGEGDPYRVDASLRVSETGMEVVEIGSGFADGGAEFDVGPVRLHVTNLRVPRITWTPAAGWDWEFLVDLGLGLDGIEGLVLPPARDVIVGPAGLLIPAWSVADLPAVTIPADGFDLVPLAVRTGAVAWNPFVGDPGPGAGQGGVAPGPWDIRMDLEVGFGSGSESLPGALGDLRLTVLDATWTRDGPTGDIELRSLLNPIRLPLGDEMALELRHFEGTLRAGSGAGGGGGVGAGPVEVEVTAGGGWVLPASMQCAQGAQVDAPVAVDGSWLTFGGDGQVRGVASGLVPTCPLKLGPLSLAVATADLELDWGPSGRRAELALEGALRLPAPGAAGGGDSISAPGALRVDLVEGRIVSGAIEVATPFAWDLPAGGDPLFRFTVARARLDAEGFRLDADGSLPLDEGASVGVTFDALRFELPSLAIVGGEAVFQAGVALDARIATGPLAWSVRSPSTPRPGTDGVRLDVQAGATISALGLALAGSGRAEVTLGGERVADLGLRFGEGFRLALDPLAVADGRADLLLEETVVAWVDRNGFWPGDLFAALPIPDRIGLPTEEVAWLELRDAQGELRVESEVGDEGIRVRGAGVRVGLPALAGGGAPPEVTVDLDLLLNPASFQVVSGAIEVAGEPLFDLSALGLPLDVRRVALADAGTGPRLSLSGEVRLPAALGDAALAWRDVVLTENGLSGRVGWGTRGPAGTDVGAGTARIGSEHLALGVSGLLVDFDQRSVVLDGSIEIGLFADGSGATPPLPFTAEVGAGSALTVALDRGSLPSRLPVGVGEFELLPLEGREALELFVDNESFRVGMGGVLRLPALARDFALTLPRIDVDRSGIRVSGAALEGEQELSLFGARFGLRSVGGAPSLAVEVMPGPVVAVTLSGDVTLPFLPGAASFSGLRVSTDGQVTLAGADLLAEPFVVVPEMVTLARLTVADNRLQGGLDVTLPAPLATGTQRLDFRLAPDGTLEGGGRVALVQQAANRDAALPASSPVALQLRYLGAELAPGSGGAGGIEVVADLYLGSDAGNRVELGRSSGGTIEPGLKIGFDGSVAWTRASLPGSFVFDLDLLRLTLETVSLAGGPGAFTVGFGGELRLDIPGLEGGLDFENFRVGSDLQVAFDPTGVRGGDLMIGGIVGLRLEEFGFSAEPTTIEVAAGSGSAGGVSEATETVAVDSYVRFGGGVSFLEFSGGMREVLFYREAGEVRFVLREAEMTLPNLFTASADLRYATVPGGFRLLLGARAELLGQVEGMMVGLIETNGVPSETRAGLFVAAAARVPLVPPVFLGSVGGGFFLNADQETLDLVARTAMGDGATISVGTEKFTALLYGALEIVDPTVATGAVLLAGSPAGVQLLGNLRVLEVATAPFSAAGAGGSGGAPIEGSLDVRVGFRQKFIEGGLELTVGIAPLVTGSAQTAFFVYGTDAWGLSGSGDLNYLQLLNGGADFFVGPPGFMVGADLRAGLDIWVVSVEGNAEVAAWYQRAYQGREQDFGAYFEAGMRVALLGETVSASGTLRGALLQGPLVYGGGRVEACAVVLGCENFDVWVKLSPDGPSAGFGSDPVLQEILARANSVRSNMADARASIEEEVALSRPQLSDMLPGEDELEAAYLRMAALDPASFLELYERAVAAEGNRTVAEMNYHAWYRSLFGVLEKGAAYRLETTGLEDRVDENLAAIEALRGPVLEQMEQIRTDLLEIRQEAAMTWPTNPVTARSFAAPVTQTSVDAEGNEIRTLLSGPGFEVDAGAAGDQAAVAEYEARMAAALQEVAERIRELDDDLADIGTLLYDGGSSSLLRFAEHHVEALEATEAYHAAWGSYVYQEELRQGRNGQQLIFRRAPELSGILRSKSSVGGITALASLTERRLGVLAEWTGDATLVESVLGAAPPATPDNRAWWETAADSAGFMIWHHVGRLGIEAVLPRYPEEIRTVRAEMAAKPEPIRGHLGRLTRDIHGLQMLRAELTGTLHDLYDRYLSSLPEGDAAAEGVRTQVLARRAALAQSLTVPTVTEASVRLAVLPFRHEEIVTLSGTHPSGGGREFLFENRAGQAAPAGFIGYSVNGFLSAGRRQSFTRHVLIPEPADRTPQTRTVRTAVRAGAGFPGFALTTYQVAWDSGEPGIQGGSASMNETSTLPVLQNPRFRVPGTGDWSTSATAEYWITSGARLEIRIPGGFHAASGIADHQYAIGTAANPTAAREWTSLGGRSEAAVHGLELEPGGTYHVYGRVQAGNGQWSVEKRSAPFRFDPSSPVVGDSLFAILEELEEAAREMREAASARERDFGALNSAADPVCALAAPRFVHGAPSSGSTLSLGFLGGVSSTFVPPGVSLRIPRAEDPESGVAGLAWWIQTGEAPRTFTGEGWNPLAASADRLHLDSTTPGLTYQEDLHFGLSARNGAGTWSAPVTTRFRIPDPTPPVAPRLCISQIVTSGGDTSLSGSEDDLLRKKLATKSAPPGVRVGIRFGGPASDPETGVASYEYRIRTQGGDVVRDWTGTPDWTSVNSLRVEEVTLPGAVDGTRYYVDIRVRNGQGLTHVSTSGPLLVDATPPPTPAIESLALVRPLRYGRETDDVEPVRAIDLVIQAPDDPHSGLRAAHHQWVLFEVDDEGAVIAPLLWDTFRDAVAGSYGARIDRLESVLEPGGRYRIVVRTFNGANTPSGLATRDFLVGTNAAGDEIEGSRTLDEDAIKLKLIDFSLDPDGSE